MSPASLTVVTLLIVTAVLLPVLWISQRRSRKIFGRPWFQSAALVSFGLMGPLFVDLFQNNALDLQIRVAVTFVLCGLVLPWVVALLRITGAGTPRQDRPVVADRSRTSNYSSRRKRAGY